MANFGGVGELPRLLPCTQGTAAFFVVFPLHFRLGMVDKTRYTTGGSASFEEYECASGGEGQKMTYLYLYSSLHRFGAVWEGRRAGCRMFFCVSGGWGYMMFSPGMRVPPFSLPNRVLVVKGKRRKQRMLACL